MFENSTSEATEKNTSQQLNRRSYLRLASAVGTSLGTGVGMSALGSDFTASARAATTVVDDFSDTNLDGRYVFDSRGATTSVATVSSAVTNSADTNVLQMEGDGNTRMHAYKGDSDTDLNAYPEIGDTFSCWLRGLNGTENLNFMYGIKDANNKYYVKVNLETGSFGLFKYVSGSGQSLKGDWSNPTVESNTGWFKIEIDWTTDHTHTVTLYQNGSQVTSFSYTEGSSDPQFTATGVGYSAYLGSSETVQYDYATTTGSSSSDGEIDAYKFVDSFENGNLDAYSFDRGESGAKVVGDGDYTGPNELGGSYGGFQSLKLSGDDTEMISTSGLEHYPSAGDTFGCWVMAVDGSETVNISYGVQDHLHRYFIRLDFGGNKFELYRYEDWDSYPIASDNSGFSLSINKWYWVEVKWKADGIHDAYLYNTDGDSLSEIKGIDSTWNSGGIGFDAYLSSSSGTVYFDDYTVRGHSPDWQGGWGVQPLDSYGEDPGDDSKNVSYFEYFLNTVSTGGGTQDLSNGSSVEYRRFVLNLGGLFHTYKQYDVFEDQKEPKYLDPIKSQRRNEISIEIQNADSTYVNNGFDYLKRPAGYTYTSWLNQQEWRGWIDNNLGVVEGEDEIEAALESNDNINASSLIPSWVELAFTMYGLVTIPIGGTLVTASDVLIAASSLAGLLKEQDCELTPVYGDSKQTEAGLVWKYCGDYPLTSVTAQYIVRVPKDDSVTIKAEVKAGDGGGQYPASETGVWELDYNGNGNVPNPSRKVTDT